MEGDYSKNEMEGDSKSEMDGDYSISLANFERLKILATEKFKDKQWMEAMKYYIEAADVMYMYHPNEGVMNSDPTRLGFYAICRSNIAQCCINFGDFNNAIKYSTEALSTDPKNLKAFYRRGISHLKLNQDMSALDDFKSVLVLDPRNKEAAELAKKIANAHLVNAVLSGNIENVLSLFEIGANVNFCNSKGEYPLIVASEEGHLDVVDLLLSNGANVHNKCSDGASARNASPLMVASRKGHFAVVELLLSKGANVHDKDKDGRSSLFLACINGFLDVVELLVSKGANARDRSRSDDFDCLMATCYHGHTSIVKYLISNGANIHFKNGIGYSALWLSCARGHSDIAELLLDKGVDVNYKTDVNPIYPTELTALTQAISCGYESAVKLLLSNGATFTDRYHNGVTCFTLPISQDVSHDTKQKNIEVLRKWPISMAILVFQELHVYTALFEVLDDLQCFVGLENDYLL